MHVHIRRQEGSCRLILHDHPFRVIHCWNNPPLLLADRQARDVLVEAEESPALPGFRHRQCTTEDVITSVRVLDTANGTGQDSESYREEGDASERRSAWEATEAGDGAEGAREEPGVNGNDCLGTS